MKTSKSLDMTQGAVWKKLLIFVIPAILSNLLQQMYTIADRVVVGRFAQDGTTALAAVGSTGQVTTLFLNIFVGMAIGANVVCSNHRGAKNMDKLEKSMHTAILLAIVSGICISIAGILLCEQLLSLLGTPRDLMEQATLYTRIYFMGVPGALAYNYGANLLRANGDTKRPMYILSITGLVNVGLNLLLVIYFRMDVAGVAIATITAQYLSAITVLFILFNPKGEYKMSVKRLRFHKESLKAIVRIGVPGGLNGMVFTLSNTVILTGVNSFNSAVISAAKTAATDLSTMIYQVIMGFYVGCISFAGQCYGAKKYRRIDKLALTAVGMGSIMLAVIGILYTLFGSQLLSLFNDNQKVIREGIGPLRINAWFYVLYLLSEIPLGCLRGMKRSGVPSFLNLLGICVPRVLWVTFAFPVYRSLTFLFVCYPISWLISAALQWGYYFHIRKQLLKREQVEA